MASLRVQNQEYVKKLKFDTVDIVKSLDKIRNFTMSITAKRRMGKSVLMKALCYEMRDWYEDVYVFSETAEYQPDLFDYVDSGNVFNTLDEDKLQKIWDAQAKRIMGLRAAKVPEEKMPHILLLFDDIIGDERVRHSKILNNFFIKGRHIKFAVMIISQVIGGKYGLPSVLRINVDVAIGFFLNSETDRELFYKQYLSTNNAKIGSMIFDSITHTQYQAIVIQNHVTDPDPEKYVNTFIADLKVPKFDMSKHFHRGRPKYTYRIQPSSGFAAPGALDIVPPILNEGDY